MASHKAQSLSSDQEINDGLAEIELQKLQRQYRIMEGDRKAYSEESRIVITKQRATIEKLKRDNEHLHDELRLLETRNEDRRRNGAQSKKAENLADQAETFQKKIKLILAEITSLDNHIALMDRDIDHERAQLGGVNAASQNSEAIEKQIRVLENRLDKALVKFNKSLAVNKRLRATIDNLRRERLVFDNIYRKFEKELLEQKKQMAEIIEMSNSAYEARDEAQAKIIALREKADKEYQAYIQEIKELDRALEQDRKLKEFMATKVADRGESHLGGSSSHKRNEKDSFAKNMQSQDDVSESLDTYEKAFAEIRKVTGTQDIGELVQRFKAVEDQNFSLFNYVNEINNEIEKMAEEIVCVQRQIDGLKVEMVAAEEETKRVMRGLENTLEQSREKCIRYEKEYTETTQLLDDLRKGTERLIKLFRTTHLACPIPKPIPNPEQGDVASMNINKTEEELEQEFSEKEGAPEIRSASARMRADFAQATDALLGSHGVTDTNLLQCLGLVEHKTNELLTLHYIFNNQKKTSAGEEKSDAKESGIVVPINGVGGLLGQGPMPAIGSMSIQAPSTGDDHDDGDDISDDEDRPMTREELTQKTLRGLSKREKMAGAPKMAAKKKKKQA
ncbi:UNVERIFIED_CONTAM: Coiled-coil domain-containing protein 63 [Siphonaria sp. JEL0065]|nr:Coiled-coil domain-containing protein 63 [Siphonaria sp. JEL0065]